MILEFFKTGCCVEYAVLKINVCHSKWFGLARRLLASGLLSAAAIVGRPTAAQESMRRRSATHRDVVGVRPGFADLGDE